MAEKRRKPAPLPPAYLPCPVPMAAIRSWARQLAARFRPDRVILFGSHAYGWPHAESDVDILVVMHAADEINQSVRLTCAFDPPFPLDLIVRTPKNLEWRLKEGDWFLREIVSRGKVLYESPNGRVGPKGRSRRARRKKSLVGPSPIE
jgi:predicted nucleotidyltransferase